MKNQYPSHLRSALELFTQHKGKVAEEHVFLHYYGRTFTYGEVESVSTSIALFLQEELKIQKGDRVAICMQNIPQYVLAVLAVWKVGAIIVPVSPMSREKEIEYTLNDSGATVLFTLKGELQTIANNVWPQLKSLSCMVVTSPLEYLPEDAGTKYPELKPMIDKTKQQDSQSHTSSTGRRILNFSEITGYHSNVPLKSVQLSLSDIAFLTYTSGTTGPSKGAMNTHGNVVFNSYTFLNWAQLTPSDVILGVAPYFHITGLVSHITLSFAGLIPLVLTWQFQPSVIGRLISNYKCTFTVAASTVFTALIHDPVARKADFSSFKKCYSGGAPVSPALIEMVQKTFGILLHCAYGMTETTAPTHLTPLGQPSPIDPATNAASIGKTIYDTVATIVDEKHNKLPPGEIGEIAVKGPSIVPGYWKKPEETRKAFDTDGTIYTGDVGLVDKDGWFFLVDRKKDLIIASGFKIWPREVEDVIYKHPKVKEVAVVGVPDEYRGETVKAFVSVKDGETVTPQEIIDFCKSRMAAYKYPRLVEIIKDVPKNLSGKVLRRELRPKL